MFNCKKARLRAIALVAIFGWAFLAVFGRVEAANPSIDSVLRTPTEPGANTRYFTDGTGKAIYLTGSHTWANLQDYKMVERNHPDFDYEEYLKFLVANNHNFIRLWITTDAECDWKNGVSAYPAVYKLDTAPMPCAKRDTDDGAKYDLDTINPLFLNRLEDRVRRAQERGIYVSIMLFDSLGAGYAIPYDPNDSTDREMEKSNPFRDDNNINGINADTDGNGRVTELHTNLAGEAVKNIQKKYIQKVVETVNDFDNVLYEIGNELPFESFEFQKDMINYIHGLEAVMDKKHPVGITPVWLHLNGVSVPIPIVDYIDSPADWISPSFPDFSVNVPLANSSKVNILDTDHGGNPRSDNDSTGVWKAFLRGHNYIYMDIYQLPFGCYYEDAWRAYGRSKGGSIWNDPVGGGNGNPSNTRRAMGHTKTYADKMDLKNMIPIDSDTTTICSSTHFCLAKTGSEYLVYQPNTAPTINSFSVKLPVGIYNYEWVHPISGKVERIGSKTSTGGSNSFSPPFAGDAVLYLTTGNIITSQCADGADNDGDGKFDLDDPGCKNDPNYNDEKDAIPEQPGLVGHWQLDEPAGSMSIKDASIYGNDGTNHGAILGQSGVKGSASYFDGLKKWYNYMEIEDPGDNSVFDFKKGESITISVWIKPEDLELGRAKNNEFTIIAKQDFGFALKVHTPVGPPPEQIPTGDKTPSKLGFTYQSPKGSFNNYFVSGYPIHKGQLYHIAITYTYGARNTMKAYINGVLQSGGWWGVISTADAPDPNNNVLGATDSIVSNKPIFIGYSYPAGYTEEWHGMIDDVRIYNKILPEAEIKAIYNDRKNPDCSDGVDSDNDSYFYSASSDPDCGTQDCNDGNAAIYPGAMELCADGVDNDCDSLIDANDSDCRENNGLVARWKLDGNATDSSGKNNNGSLSAGMDCAATGRIGQACAFNGAGNFISVPDSTLLRLNKDITLASWVKWDGAFHSFDWSYILEKGKDDDDNYAFGICGSGAGCSTPRLFFEFTDAITNTRHVLRGSKTVAVNDWLHVATVYDSTAGMLRFYQDGVLDNSSSVTGLPLKGTQDSSLSLGKQNSAGLNLWFSGLMDDTRIYNRVLAPAEIASLANPSDFDSTDVNEDGSVNIKDIQEVIRCIINSQACAFSERSDVNNDERINIKDIQEIIRKIINPN